MLIVTTSSLTSESPFGVQPRSPTSESDLGVQLCSPKSEVPRLHGDSDLLRGHPVEKNAPTGRELINIDQAPAVCVCVGGCCVCVVVVVVVVVVVASVSSKRYPKMDFVCVPQLAFSPAFPSLSPLGRVCEMKRTRFESKWSRMAAFYKFGSKCYLKANVAIFSPPSLLSAASLSHLATPPCF